MYSKLLTPVICALTIFAIGAGIAPVVANEGNADPVAYAQVLAGDANLRVLPTVTVFAELTSEEEAAANEGSVMLSKVQHAGDQIARRVTTGVRRVSLAVPYYAFGGVARRASE